MSVDTISRVWTKIDTDLITGEGYEVIDMTLTEDLPMQLSGPYIEFRIEVATDTVLTDDEATYDEDGVLIFQIFNEKGSGDRDLHTYADTIKTNFRQTRILPGVGEKGDIVMKDMTQRTVVEVDRENGEYPWMRLDVLIDYSKCYDE